MPKPNDVCTACGGYEFSLNDGFMYCDRCGTVLENFEELEEEEGGMQQTLGAGRVKIKKTDEEEANKKKRAGPRNFEHFASNSDRMARGIEKRSEFLARQMDRREDLPHDETPDYLYSVGVRLATFTRILAKSTYILANEMGFDSSVQENGFAVFQKYLAHCQVAFCAAEQCGADEEMRFVAIMENVRYEEEEREAKRRKKLARRGKGVSKLSKSAAAWQLLTQGNITENLDVETDEDEEEEEEEEGEVGGGGAEDTMNETRNIADETMGFVRKITTELSKNAVRRAAQCLLNLEILVAILHSALMSSGYQNLMVSDVVRWIREDRFRISLKSQKLLRCGETEKSQNSKMNNVTTDRKLQFPLYEIQRTCTMFQQSVVHLTLHQAPLEFEQLAARLIDNLNLPTDMLCRVLLLESIVPCDVSPMLKKQAEVQFGHKMADLADVETSRITEHFMTCFGRKEWAKVVGVFDEVLLSPETKIIAYILLALKLTFDIDHEKPDSSRSPESDGSDGSNEAAENDETVHHFTIDTWIHQLEMRIKCWQGHDMTMVLRQSCPIPPIHQTFPFGDEYFVHHGAVFPFAARFRRQLGFRQCIPSEMSFHSTATLPTVFDIREHRYRTERNRSEAILAPLKFQNVVLQREIDSNTNKYQLVDEQSRNTFFRDFGKYQSTDVAETFEEIFPFSSCYESYTRPDFLSNCSARKTRFTPATGPYRLFLGLEAIEDLIGVARPSFSDRFQFLLKSLSLIIGEDEKAVYAAFVMLETLLLGVDELGEMQNDLLASNPIPIDGVVYSDKNSRKRVKYGIVSSIPVESINELRDFTLSCRFFEHPELATESEDVEFLKFSRNCHILESVEEDAEGHRGWSRRISHNFDKLLSILALKIW